MSFTSETKLTLCDLGRTKECCKRAELYGLLAFGSVFSADRIKYVTENRPLSEMITALLFELYGVEANFYVSEKKSRGEYEQDGVCRGYKITVSNTSATNRIYSSFLNEKASSRHIPKGLFLCAECADAFLRGAFLSSGMVSDPSDSYHLEISTTHFVLSQELAALLCERGIDAKLTKRHSSYVVYIKRSEEIENFLIMIGAKKAVFRLMDEKIRSDIRNNANRISNCEVANLDKSIGASQLQIAAIHRLEDSGKLGTLSEELQNTARLRLENPGVTVGELARLHMPPISKSGATHRLAKLVALSEK